MKEKEEAHSKSILCSIEDLAVHYGLVEAVKSVNLTIHHGEIVALVGANGAGKSTTLLSISGLLKSKFGKILLNDQNHLIELNKLKPHQIVEKGIIQVPEGRAILTYMTILENLKLGAYSRKDSVHLIQQDIDWIFSLFPRLKERQNQLAGNLSGGEQQMLAIGRALMAKPKLLLLDEPSMGLAPIIVQEIFEILKNIHREHHLAMLLVEQNVQQALKFASRGYVLENGHIVLEDTSNALIHNPKVIEAYLGG